MDHRRPTRSPSLLVRLLAVLGLLLLHTSGLSAAPVHDYTASITPTTDTAGHVLSGYMLTITNSPSSNWNLGSANVTVPSGYSAVVLGTVTPPTGKTWTATLVSSVIELRASGGGDRLDSGESVSVALTATAPCPASSPTIYTWSTLAQGDTGFNGSEWFTLIPPDPQVEVTGSCTPCTETVRGDETGRSDPYLADGLLCEDVTYELLDAYTGEYCGEETVPECEPYASCDETVRGAEIGRTDPYLVDGLLCEDVTYELLDAYTGAYCGDETVPECEPYASCDETVRGDEIGRASCRERV